MFDTDSKYGQLDRNQRFKEVNQKVNTEVKEYLYKRLQELTIKICAEDEHTLIELMKKGRLEGWCWQTTESCIVFLNDNDYIERGYLRLDKNTTYYHSWICFKYKGMEYVFDPCLNVLCKKNTYTKVFETDVQGKVTSKQVRDCLIASINNPKKPEYEGSKEAKDFMARFFANHVSQEVLNRQREEIHMYGEEDITSPTYRNNTGYRATIEEDKVKKLVAHYYLNV